MVDKKLVFRIEPGMDRQSVLATTYQMRNFYQQFKDGFFTVLDVMNYIQHHTVVKMIHKGDHVLDMCCGRGLLLPLLRYYRKEIESYTGVDIKQENAIYRTKRVTDNKPLERDYYPFTVYFAEVNVAEMTKVLPVDYYNFIVYTSSIEHMHPDLGRQSLSEARKVATYGATLFLTCPNTPEDQNGYDTQYAAHVYEWKQSEIKQALIETGWRLVDVYGLLIDNSVLNERLANDAHFQRQSEYIPREWLNPLYAMLFPDAAKELAYIAKAE